MQQETVHLLTQVEHMHIFEMWPFENSLFGFSLF